jgi:hypothetical protein
VESTVGAEAGSELEWLPVTLPVAIADWFVKGLKIDFIEKLKEGLELLPKLSVGVGVGVAEATSVVASGSTLNVGGSLTIDASIAKKQEVKAGAKGRFALGVGVSVFSGSATAALDGTVTAGKDVSVTSALKTDGNKVEAGAEFKPEKPDEDEPAPEPAKKEYNPRDYYPAAHPRPRAEGRERLRHLQERRSVHERQGQEADSE